MFIRKKKNRSGSTSVVVVSKLNGKYREIHTIGVSKDEGEIALYTRQGNDWIADKLGEQDLFTSHFKKIEEKETTTRLLNNVEHILLNGEELLLNQVFSLVGFDAIEDDIFRQLVIARLSQPMSKNATVAYLKSHFDEDVYLHQIYRYLDKLYNTEKEKVQRISVEHTRKILGGQIGLLFYDVTTLYFETDHSDELRERGFSKDGKHSQPQIVLGLLVSKDGYPLSYSIFNGSQYEGRTMLPIVDDFVQRFNLENFVVVADSGLMNKRNLELLNEGKYEYIIGARIKNESEAIKTWVLDLPKEDYTFYEYEKESSRLIVSYSSKRAKKDKYNRDKGVRRLEKAYKSGKLTKGSINKRGYNKFLEISDDVTVKICEEKIQQDQKWDGLKGYITNTDLPAEEVYRQYSSLWEVERAFRITKGTIELRPMFHFSPKRIEAHICICFAAYKIYKELERVLRISNIDLSVDKVIDIAKTITTIRIKLPQSGETISKTMFLTERQKEIQILYQDYFWKGL